MDSKSSTMNVSAAFCGERVDIVGIDTDYDGRTCDAHPDGVYVHFLRGFDPQL